MVMPMPKEIRQIQIHLWGERRDRDTPTDRKECASDKCTLPSAKPSLDDECPRNSNSCQSYLFSIPSSVLQTSWTWTDFCLKRSIGAIPLNFHPPRQQFYLPGALWRAWKSHVLTWKLEWSKQARSRRPHQAPGPLARPQPASLTLPRRTSEGLKDSPPPPKYAVQETNAGCPTSSRLVLNFNLFGHLLNCY